MARYQSKLANMLVAHGYKDLGQTMEFLVPALQGAIVEEMVNQQFFMSGDEAWDHVAVATYQIRGERDVLIERELDDEDLDHISRDARTELLVEIVEGLESIRYANSPALMDLPASILEDELTNTLNFLPGKIELIIKHALDAVESERRAAKEPGLKQSREVAADVIPFDPARRKPRTVK